MSDDKSSETTPQSNPDDREKLLERLKRETSRLSLSDAKPPTRIAPKTIQLKRPQPTGSRPDSKSATTISRPPTLRGKQDTTKIREAPTVTRRQESASGIIDSLDASIAEDMKKVTSRILLEDIIPTEPAVDPKMTTMPVSGLMKPPSTRISKGIPKTIKLKRPPLSSPAQRAAAGGQPGKAPTSRITPSSKTKTTPIEEAPTIIKKPPVGKRETSVINVGDTIAKPASKQTSKIPDASTPKTIQLKRSSTAEPVVKDTDSDNIAAAKKSETAKISLPDQAISPDSAPVTQRKTIKIKRSERNTPATSGVAVAMPSRVFQRKPQEEESTAVDDDTISIVFSIAAVLAVLFAGCLVYILTAQAFAPDLTLPVPGLN